MRLDSQSAAALALAFALAACGGADQTDEPSAVETPAATVTPVPGDATPAPTDAASPAPTDTTLATPAPTPAATAAPTVAAATEPAAFAVCKACHSVEPGKHGIGPSLAGIWGEEAGDVDGYEFSEAMDDSDLRWNQATLDRYLTDPRGTVPGTKMAFGGVSDAAKRQAIIDYIKGL